MCNVQALITNGLVRVAEADGDVQEEQLTFEFVLLHLMLLYTHVLQTQGQTRAPSFPKAFADSAPPIQSPHGSL
jgi:hypothetical protein